MRRFLAGTVLLLLVPNAASASTLSSKKADGVTVVTYAATPGEVNLVQFSIDNQGERVTVTDSGATIEAGGACRVEAGSASCPTGAVFEVNASLGDGDDSLQTNVPERLSNAVRTVDGGPGTDTLITSGGTLKGGEGDDALTITSWGGLLLGGPGADILTGGAGGLEFQGGPGTDTIDAGDFDDQQVSYEHATGPVTADLSGAGPMGPEGEQDTVTGADGVEGGRFDDVLTGDAGDNFFVGNGGDDTIDAGDGSDSVLGGSGSDEIAGGAGDDDLSDGGGPLTPEAVVDGGDGDDEIRGVRSSTVLGGDGNDELRFGAKSERVKGGAGRDVLFTGLKTTLTVGISCGADEDVIGGPNGQLLPADCELIDFPNSKVTLTIANAIELDGTALSAPVPNLCFDLGKCDIRTDLLIGKRRVGRETVRCTYRNGRNRNGEATFTLSPADLRAIEEAGQVTVHYVPPEGARFGERELVFVVA